MAAASLVWFVRRGFEAFARRRESPQAATMEERRRVERRAMPTNAVPVSMSAQVPGSGAGDAVIVRTVPPVAVNVPVGTNNFEVVPL